MGSRICRWGICMLRWTTSSRSTSTWLKSNEKFSSNSLKDHVSSDARTLKARGHRREERLLKNDALNWTNSYSDCGSSLVAHRILQSSQNVQVREEHIRTWNRRLECWRNMMVSIFSIRNDDVNLSSSRWSNTMSKHQKDYSEYWFSDDADWGSDRCESLNHFNESIFTWGWRRLKYSAGAWRWARGRRCVPDHRRATSDLLQA